MTNKYTLYERVRSNVLFQSVEEPIIQTILLTLKEIKFADEKVIFQDDSIGECLFLVFSGSVKISKQLRTGEEIVLGILHSGDFFGELDLIDQQHRSAQATAIGDCVLGKLNKKDFDILLETSQTFALNLLHMVTLRLRTNNLTYVQHQESNLITLRQQLAKTRQLVDASKIVNSSLDVDQLLDLIFQTAARTVGADRGTLYLIDEAKKELWSKVQKGSSRIEIRLPMGVGIAGTVAATGTTINIEDAYNDPRFNQEIDQVTGYRTRATLCMPMKNRNDKTIGVFQLLNKTEGMFTREDEEFIEAFSVHAALAIENAQLAQRMVQNERLSAVGRMASTIIHDIKNPMGVLRLSAQVIKSRADDQEIEKFADDIIRQTDRFIAMTQEILDFARGISSINFENVNFGELMDTLMLIIEKEMMRHDINIETKLEYRDNIKIDPEKFLRVLYNITGNAADAMEKGGKIIVKAFKSDAHLVIEFIDNGKGMSEQVKTKIFEPFFTSGKKHGTGLGMAIVKKIMDDHKGSIEINSMVGKGTTIRLLFPL
jgi:K+-sensing histidine kinase KdpD